jgi:hypothetical protein
MIVKVLKHYWDHFTMYDIYRLMVHGKNTNVTCVGNTVGR